LLIPKYLVGYRELPDNMSSHVRTMLRSRDLCIAELAPRHPRFAAEFKRGRTRMMRFLLSRSIRRGDLADVGWLVREMIGYDPWSTVLNACILTYRAVLRVVKAITYLWAPRFEIGHPLRRNASGTATPFVSSANPPRPSVCHDC